jgi:hypothetical protein
MVNELSAQALSSSIREFSGSPASKAWLIATPMLAKNSLHSSGSTRRLAALHAPFAMRLGSQGSGN